MSQGKIYLLLDFRSDGRPVDADQVGALLSTVPGVLGVRTFPQMEQAEVVLAAEGPAQPEVVAERLRTAGYWVRVSTAPDPLEDSGYARYFHAGPDSSESRWVD
jgi:hypothetical protein